MAAHERLRQYRVRTPAQKNESRFDSGQNRRTGQAVAPGRAGATLAAGLPHYIEHGPYLFVHAGIRPGIALASQQPYDLLAIREEFWHSAAQFERVIVFGHTPTHRMGAAPGEIWIRPDRIGIDTGAKHGLRLTLVDLTCRKSYSCSTKEKGTYTDFRMAAWGKNEGCEN